MGEERERGYKVCTAPPGAPLEGLQSGGGRPREAPADLINDSEAADSSLSHTFSHLKQKKKKKGPDFLQPNVSLIFNIKEFIITDNTSS